METNMKTLKKIVVKVIFDITCAILAFVPWIVLKTVGSPFKRGFFCDDESLKHPHFDSSISSTLATSLSIILPLLIIMVVELAKLIRSSQGSDRLCQIAFRRVPDGYIQIHPAILCAYAASVLFLFGMAVNESLTNIGKYAVGRLRPHFFDICMPNRSRSLCQDNQGFMRYVTEDVCTGSDEEQLLEMRLSFPSGHASITMYAAVFATIYLERRARCPHSKLIRHLVQAVLIWMAIYTGFTRISDYKHHWSDVLAGSLLGVTVAFLMWQPSSSFRDYSQGRHYRTNGNMTPPRDTDLALPHNLDNHIKLEKASSPDSSEQNERTKSNCRGVNSKTGEEISVYL